MPNNVVEVGQLKCRVLEAKEDSFPDKVTGQPVKFNVFVVRTSAGMVKIRPSKDFDFKPYLDKDVMLNIGLAIFNLQPSLIALSIAEKK